MESKIKLTAGGVPIKNMAELLLDVCRGYGISLDMITSAKRSQMLVRARKVFATRAYNECGASYNEIGIALGNRHNTTILYYIRTSDFKTDVKRK